MYDDFAEFYDALTEDVNYTERTNYLLRLFKKYDRVPTLMLDLACGTGGFSNEFAKKGISVIGVDISPEMLIKAKENSECAGTDVLYLCQSSTELDLYGTVDGAVCCIDSINHITSFGDVKKSFEKVSLFLEKDRLFIFDVNTEYKHKEVLGNNTFVIEDDNIYCVWQNEYKDEEKTVGIYLDFFKECDGVYERSGEFITERAYSVEMLKSALEESGFCVESVFDDMTEDEPKPCSERLVFVARKVK